MTTDRFIIEQRRSLEDPTIEADDYLIVTDRLGKLPPVEFYFYREFDLIRELVHLANIGEVQPTGYVVQD